MLQPSAPRRYRQPLALLVAIALFTIAIDVFAGSPKEPPPKKSERAKPMTKSDDFEKATFAGGCFWCTEAVFQRIKGVKSVVSGYAGGEAKTANYHAVCTGATGHAEAVQITYDPKTVSYAELLEVFWKTHDPTTLNRQGNDVGTQYRSEIFYHNQKQKELAEHYKAELDKSGAFPRPIVTKISPFTTFFAAEDYHQDYFDRNSSQPYCSMVIRPKLRKLKKVFADKLKKP